jgi:hypothetical protein
MDHVAAIEVLRGPLWRVDAQRKPRGPTAWQEHDSKDLMMKRRGVRTMNARIRGIRVRGAGTDAAVKMQRYACDEIYRQKPGFRNARWRFSHGGAGMAAEKDECK